MRPRWELEVEGLGRIERAVVDVHPLMLFVGPNNTGKSYLASLLWGLLAMQDELVPPPGPALEACDAWLAQHITPERHYLKHELSDAEIAMFDALFESALSEGQNRLVSRIFRKDSMRVGNLRFRNASPSRRAFLAWSVEQPKTTNTLMVHKLDLRDPQAGEEKSLGTEVETNDFQTLRNTVRDLLMRRLTFFRMTRLFKPFEDDYQPIDPIYLPASRTGFMQLYKSAAQRSVRDTFRGGTKQGDWLDLTTPAFHFISMLMFGLEGRGAQRYSAEADMLESALAGKIEKTEGTGINEFRYRPSKSPEALSMSRSSSVVSELAPLILVLRYVSSIPVLILEEPEAHLHPALQCRLAQVIVRLIRKGLYVWVTTHSENFCQQINNFLKLGALDEDQRAEAHRHLGYDPQDYLEVDDIAGYEFKLDAATERSTVVAMRKKTSGIVMPTFNHELLRLGKEVDYLESLAKEV